MASNPTNLMIITDVGKDIDDALALIVLGYLQYKRNEVRISCIVTNLKTQERRSRTAQALMLHMGLGNVNVGIGSNGSDENHMEREYEYNPEILLPGHDHLRLYDGHSLMVNTLREHVSNGSRTNIVCMSSLRDIARLCRENPLLVSSGVESIYVQGGVTVDTRGRVLPDPNAANNKFDMVAAREFYGFVQSNNIKCVVCTKHAALASKLEKDFIADLRSMAGRVPSYVYNNIMEQMMAFYRQACSSTPYAPFMNKQWWVKNITVWNESHGDKEAPEDETILEYVRIPVYDMIAAIFAVSDDLGLHMGMTATRLGGTEPRGNFSIVGMSESDTGVTPDITSRMLSTLLVTALMNSRAKDIV